jgi:hypothetical protein
MHKMGNPGPNVSSALAKKNRPVDPTPGGESQEVSSVIVCRLILALYSEFGRSIARLFVRHLRNNLTCQMAAFAPGLQTRGMTSRPKHSLNESNMK